MARIPMTLVRLKVTFAVLSLCNIHNEGNIACFNYSVLHINWKAHAACDLNFIVNGKGLLKVTGIVSSHIHWKSGNILKTVLDTVEM